MIRTTIVYTGLEGMPAVNQIYWSGSGPSIADAAADATTAFATGLANNLTDNVTVDVSNLAVEINEATGVIVEFHDVTGGSANGIVTFDPLPVGTSAVLALESNEVVRGRRLQGRLYLPALTEDALSTGGLLDNPYIGAIDSLASTTLGAASAVHVVWSRPLSGGAPGTVAPVATYATRRVLSNLRSRRR